MKNLSHYSFFSKPYLFSMQQLKKDLISVLLKNGVSNLSGKEILEIGCGSGGVLLDYVTLGADSKALFGIDILHNRLIEARDKVPTAGLACSDAQYLPFPNLTFDITIQYTAFSSILDSSVKQNMALEISRVLRPGGLLIWYDFWLNPTNPQTKGIKLAEIRDLFPGFQISWKKVTLAPPIARKLIPISWIMGQILESTTLLNSHYLVLLRKPL